MILSSKFLSSLLSWAQPTPPPSPFQPAWLEPSSAPFFSPCPLQRSRVLGQRCARAVVGKRQHSTCPRSRSPLPPLCSTPAPRPTASPTLCPCQRPGHALHFARAPVPLHSACVALSPRPPASATQVVAALTYLRCLHQRALPCRILVRVCSRRPPRGRAPTTELLNDSIPLSFGYKEPQTPSCLPHFTPIITGKSNKENT